ncbi:pyruvoyl-dependent arginine decarboxylase [Halocatena halophila]|uniref:pyruvoyl-dependent arginine decarboxylase n=1 Tax=Halocatena halophila TaxID=2814576 RepID=UPI002ED37831
MGLIRIVWGTATAPTEKASYDGALAEANIHNYNLVQLSSVIPRSGTLEVVGAAPDLGPTGTQLTVVQARETVTTGDAVAGLSWATEGNGRGIFYEASGTDPDAVTTKLADGIAAGRELRDWDFSDTGQKIVGAPAQPGDTYTTTVVCAVYGNARPIL